MYVEKKDLLENRDSFESFCRIVLPLTPDSNDRSLSYRDKIGSLKSRKRCTYNISLEVLVGILDIWMAGSSG